MSRAGASRFFRATSAALLAKALAAGVAFFAAPLLLRLLGPSVFGLWALMYAVTAYASLLEFGITSTTTLDVANAASRDDYVGVRVALRRGIRAVLGAGAVLVIVAVIISGPLLGWLSPGVGEIPAAEFMLPAAVCGWTVQRLTAVFGTILDVQGRLILSQVLPAVGQGLLPLLAIVAVAGGASIIGLSIALVAAPLLSGLVVIPVAFNQVRRHPTRGVHPTTQRRTWALNTQLQLASIADAVNFSTDRVLVATFVSLSAVATYELGARAATVVQVVLITPQALLFPILAATANPDDRRRKTDQFGVILRWLAGLMAAGSAVTAEPLVTLWLGRPAPDVAWLVQILSCAFAIHAMTGPYTAEMRASDKFKPAAIFAVSAAVLNLGLTLVLGRIYGLEGIVLATAISVSVTSVVFLTYLVRVGHGFGPVLMTLRVAAGAALAIAVGLNVPGPSSTAVDLLVRAALASVTLACFAVLTDGRVRAALHHA